MWVHGTWNLHFNKSLQDPLFPVSSGSGGWGPLDVLRCFAEF